MRIAFFRKMEPRNIPVVPLRAIWKAVLQASLKRLMAFAISGLQSHGLQFMGLTFWKVYSGRKTEFKEL